MGALGHYLEREGLATASISFVRPQTEKIRPPRALWVPFELGRPFGAPNNPAFQTRVLRALLELIEQDSGPVLADFDEDAPAPVEDATEDEADDQMGASCPIELRPPSSLEDDDPRVIEQEVLREVSQLRPWYELSVEKRGRTTVGVSRMEIDDIVRFIAGFLREEWPDAPYDSLSRGEILKYACEDVKAFYSESLMSQPGRFKATSTEVIDWFWQETLAGELFRRLDPVCAESDDVVMQHMAGYLLVPRSQTGSVGDGSDGRINPEFGSNKSFKDDDSG